MLKRKIIVSVCIAVLMLAVGLMSYGIRVGLTAAPADDQPYLAVSQARAAQAKFSEARAAMDKALLLREPVSASNLRALEAAMKEISDELKKVSERPAAASSAEWIRQAQAFARDWYESGLKIIKPPPGGLTELPLPMVVASKGQAAAAAMDKLVKQTSTHALRMTAQKYAGGEGSTE
jgi:methyl-accepting chemotaxis protein